MAKKPVVFVPFHLVIANDPEQSRVLLACGAPHAVSYVTWNVAAVTCDDCLFMYRSEAEHGVEVALLQSFYS